MSRRPISDRATVSLGETGSPRCPPGPVPGVLGRGLSKLYGLGLRLDQAKYDRPGCVERLPIPVVSVGNLTVGGTGKTPMVAWCVRTLRESGRKPLIAMRGYRKRGSASHVESDEAGEYRRVFEREGARVPIVAQADRAGGVRAFLEREADGADCVVLDDGFQHRRLARALDVVLVDCARPATRDRLLPGGWLRLPTSWLARADAVVLTHAELVAPAFVEEVSREVVAHGGASPVAVCRHVWTGLVCEQAGEDVEIEAEDLSGRRVVACCAIGSPEGFLHAVRKAAGGSVVGEMVLPDHDPFEARTVERLIELATGSRAERIVVTEKDWSKLRGVEAARWPCAVVRPKLAMRFDRGEAELAAMLHAAVRPA